MDRRVEGIIMLSQLLVVAVVEVGAELGKRVAFLVATTSLPAVYRPNGYARTTTARTPHARANLYALVHNFMKSIDLLSTSFFFYV